MCGMDESIDIIDTGLGFLQYRFKNSLKPMTPSQMQAIFRYLVAEGFLEMPKLPEAEDYFNQPPEF